VNGHVPHVLAGNRLGVAGVLFFALAAPVPLAVVAFGIPSAYAGGLSVVPWVFLAAGLVLLVFSVGYTAMLRRARTAGAIYSVVSRGLGRPLGISAGWVALLSYTALQIGAYGAAGVAARPVLSGQFGVDAPWWQVALACWAIVGLLGLVRVDVAGLLLAVLVLAETAIIVAFGAANLLDPAGGEITAPALNLSHLDRPALGLLVISAALAFAGFETTAAYAEEARRPRRAITRATYLAVLILVLLFWGAAWAMSVGGGPGLAVVAAARGHEVMFDLAGARLTPWAVTLGRIVLVTGMIAAMVALHHAIARYLFALGRDRVLPGWLGRTAPRSLIPRAASLTQTVVAGLVIGGCAYLDLDPQTQLARRLGVSGGLGILLLLIAASLSALLFLNRAPEGENAWRRFVAPCLATVAFGTLGYLAFADLAELLGVRTGDPLTWIVPGVFGAAVVLGLCYALVLRMIRPLVYAGIGLGGTAVIVSPVPPSATRQRPPGAHRPNRINRELTR